MTKGKIDKKEYNSYRNETRKKLREAETEYYNKLFDDKQPSGHSTLRKRCYNVDIWL